MSPNEPLVWSGDFVGAARYAYLDAANIALTYRGAVEAVTCWYQETGEHGSLFFDAEAEARAFVPLHEVVARLLGVEAEDIAVGSSSTELLGSLAWALAPPRGSNVISTEASFPSTVYPWSRVAAHTGCDVRLVPALDGCVDEQEVADAIDDNTAVVCLSHAEYATGQLYDLARIGRVAHEHKALLIVDAMQTAGTIPIDARSLGIDALVCGAYKWLCGPFGAAFMYLAPGLQSLQPGLVGFRSHAQMWDLQARRLELPDGARRFEASTTAFGAAVGLAASIEYLLDIGIDRVRSHNRRLAAVLRDGLGERGITVHGPADPRAQTSVVLTAAEGIAPNVLAGTLAAAGIRVSPRGSGVRISPHLYNDEADIQRLLEHLDTLR